MQRCSSLQPLSSVCHQVRGLWHINFIVSVLEHTSGTFLKSMKYRHTLESRVLGGTMQSPGLCSSSSRSPLIVRKNKEGQSQLFSIAPKFLKSRLIFLIRLTCFPADEESATLIASLWLSCVPSVRSRVRCSVEKAVGSKMKVLRLFNVIQTLELIYTIIFNRVIIVTV